MQAYEAHTARDRVRSILGSPDRAAAIPKRSRSSKAEDRERAAGLRRDCDEWFAEDHMSNIETTSVLMETVAILVRLGVEGQMLQHIIAPLDPDAGAIAKWQGLPAGQNHQPSEFAQILRGEAYVSIRGLAIPLLVSNSDPLTKEEIPDPDAFLDAFAASMMERVTRVEQTTLADMAHALVPDELEAPAGLSPGAQEAYYALQIGARAWSDGWIRAASLHVRTQAALAIMAGTEPPVEPVTGLPFVFDPATRSLSHPEDPRLDKIQTEPVTLP